MKLNPLLPAFTFLAARLRQGARGMFNLNDPRWGRDDDKPADGSKPDEVQPEKKPTRPQGSRGKGPNQGPPDLDELWRDFNRKLGGLFGGAKAGGKRGGLGGAGGGGDGGGGGGFQPDMKSAGIGAGLIAAVAVLIWLGTGFFIVQEGQQAVVTQFGKYSATVGAGFNWRLPYPIQRHEVVVVSQIRSVDVGRDTIIKATGLRDSAMLTEDENIIDVKFSVQYRLNDARQFLFETRNPNEAVVQAAETAVREVVGKMTLNAALGEEREQIAPRVRQLTQTIVDRYKIGVEIVAINMQQGGVRAPEQVQAAFDDVNRAGQERERAKNEGQAYANDVIPRAVGAASRLKEEADAYKARIVAQADGDSQRFRSVLTEYQKAPQVTRDRLYTDAMQQIYSSVTAVLVDTRQSSNLLYLPLDKLMQATAQGNAASGSSADTPLSPGSGVSPAIPAPVPNGLPIDARSRDTSRTRERETR
jgi:modulator of FtsH protease HflK